MNSTLTLHMVSGKEHRVMMRTDAAEELLSALGHFWTGRLDQAEQSDTDSDQAEQADKHPKAHRLYRSDGSSIVVNPAHVEAVNVH